MQNRDQVREILLVHPHTYFHNPSDRRGSDTLPIGFGIVNRILREQGFIPTILDIQGQNLERHQVQTFLSEHRSKRFSAILISAMSTQYAYVKWFAQKCRETWPDTKIVVGGCLAHFNYLNLLTKTAANIAILSEAENTLPGLLKTDFKDLTGIPSIAYRKSEGYQDNTLDLKIEVCLNVEIVKHPIVEIDLNDPAYQVLPSYEGIDLEAYTWMMDEYRTGNAMSARGCPFSCTFCSKQFEKFRLYPIDFIEKQIVSMKEQIPNLGYVMFIDEFVLLNLKRATEISLLMKKYKLRWSCNGRIDTFTLEMAKVIKEGGCHTVSFGVESGSDKILAAMNKRQTAAKIRKTFEVALEAGLVVNPQMIIGFPGENWLTLRHTARLYKGLHTKVRQGMRGGGFGFITPLPGSKLYDDAVASGLIKNEEDYLESLEGGFNKIRINFTNWPNEKLVAMRDKYTTIINVELGYWSKPPGFIKKKAMGFLNSELGYRIKSNLGKAPALKETTKRVLQLLRIID
ncbi:MAG: B12-binding domain-containing radical SAM protein [Peptococcaceae bacterium]|nr:B12-binding domain-containing radical SAM protein [Peptococcaceae bacterium]